MCTISHRQARDFAQWWKSKKYMTDGVTLSQFSFQIPKPLQEKYVRKKRSRISASSDDSRHLQSGEDDCTELQLGKPALLPPPSIQSSASLPFDRPVKKKARTQLKHSHSTTNPMCNQDETRVEELDQSRNWF